MSRLWHSRFGAYPSSRPLLLELARLRSHVSLEGRRLHRGRFLTRDYRITRSSRSPSARNNEGMSSAEPPQPSRGYLSAIPKATTFVSQFEEAAISGPTRAHEDDEPRLRSLISRHEVLEPATNASTTLSTRRALGSWVIVPDVLIPDTTSGGDIALDSSTEAPGVSKLVFVPGHLTRSHEESGRKHSLLALTLDYTRRLHEPLRVSATNESNGFLQLLGSVFTPVRSMRLEFRGFQPEDVACWGYILAAETADTAVRRLHIIANLVARPTEVLPISNMPYFMFTIILRSRQLSASSLALLVSILQLRLQQCKASVSKLPDATTSMIMVVRLVRHARRVAPGQLTAIADLSEILLEAEYQANPSSSRVLQRLTFNYNRLLTLLSIATTQYPFRYSAIQQKAQFKVVRQMASLEPALPVNREGYQALAKVQLAHKKTRSEQDWARTQASSWPPWREDKLGISEDVEYPGSQSRAADVLRRQVEAGYTRTDWDKAAKVLAGWDTDGSPTIQTRAVLPKAPQTLIHSLVGSLFCSDGDKQREGTEDVKIWAARIRATRTIREAWLCFCAYDTSNYGERTQEPYHAMLEKLVAPLQIPDDHGDDRLPGDGKGVRAESSSQKHHLYVPVEPPTLPSFYAKIYLDGVKPAGRFLALLLDHARSFREGIKCFEASRFAEVKKDVMLNAHKYDAEFIRSTLKHVQPFVVASFLSMLWRTRKTLRCWYRPESQAVRDTAESPEFVDLSEISVRTYVLDLIAIVTFDLQVYNKILEVIVQDFKRKQDAPSLAKGWRAISTIMNTLSRCDKEPNMATFYTVSAAIEHLMDTLPEPQSVLRLSREQDEEEVTKDSRYLLRLAKKLFVCAVVDSNPSGLEYKTVSLSSEIEDRQAPLPPALTPVALLSGALNGDVLPVRTPNWKSSYIERIDAGRVPSLTKWIPHADDSRILEVPSPAALHLLMRILVKGGEQQSILRLLRWMDRFSYEINLVKVEVANGQNQMRFAFCVAAMAIEDLITKGPRTTKQVKMVRALIEKDPAWGGWPHDDELERYLLRGRPAARHR